MKSKWKLKSEGSGGSKWRPEAKANKNKNNEKAKDRGRNCHSRGKDPPLSCEIRILEATWYSTSIKFQIKKK